MKENFQKLTRFKANLQTGLIPKICIIGYISREKSKNWRIWLLSSYEDLFWRKEEEQQV